MSGITQLSVDNLQLDGNSIISSDVNGDIILNPNGTGGIQAPDLTASRALQLNASSELEASSVTTTELSYMSGVTSSVQTQLDAKVPEALTNGNILVGSATNIATGVAMSGDIGIINDGTTSISSGVIVDGDVNASAAIAHSKMAALTANRVTETDGSGVVIASAITNTELNHLDGVTSNIQTQLDAKIPEALTSANILVGNGSNIATGVAMSGDIGIINDGTTAIQSGVIVNGDVNATAAIDFSKMASLTASRATETDGSGVVVASAITSTELNYLDNVSSNIQTQLDAKLDDFTSTTDNALVRTDGTAGEAVQDSGVIVDDSDNITGVDRDWETLSK